MFSIKVAVFEAVLMLSEKDIFTFYKLGKYSTMQLGSCWSCIAKIYSICNMFGLVLK